MPNRPIVYTAICGDCGKIITVGMGHHLFMMARCRAAHGLKGTMIIKENRCGCRPEDRRCTGHYQVFGCGPMVSEYFVLLFNNPHDATKMFYKLSKLGLYVVGITGLPAEMRAQLDRLWSKQ